MLRVLLMALFLFFSTLGAAQAAPDTTGAEKEKEWAKVVQSAGDLLSEPYLACKVPREVGVTLTAKESCLVSQLSPRCSKADDCLVQCISRGVGRAIGGGCWHLCFDSKFSLSDWHGPKGIDACWDLPDSGS